MPWSLTYGDYNVANYITCEIKTRLDRKIIAWIIYSRLFDPARATEIIGACFDGWELAAKERYTVEYILGETAG